MRLVFDPQNSRKIQSLVKDGATVDVLGVCAYTSPLPTCCAHAPHVGAEGRLYNISAWAISVARSTKLGNARSLEGGTGGCVVPTLLLSICLMDDHPHCCARGPRRRDAPV